MTPAQMQNAERTRRYIERERLTSCLNDTKWQELVAAMRSFKDFVPKYQVKHVRENLQPPGVPWDAEWYYHLPWPRMVIEWVDIDPINVVDKRNEEERRKETPDFTADIVAALRSIGVPFSIEGHRLRVWCYLRPGISPKFL
jgi:hypothetical protein